MMTSSKGWISALVFFLLLAQPVCAEELKAVWEKKHTGRHPTHVVHAGLSYAIGNGDKVTLIDADGDPLIEISVGGTVSALAYGGERLYVGTSSTITSFSMDGSRLWEKELEHPIRSVTPLPGGGAVACHRDSITLLSDAGKKRIEYSTTFTISGPAIADDDGTRFAVAAGDLLHVIGVETGKPQVFDAGDEIVPSPAFAGGGLVLGTAEGRFFILDARLNPLVDARMPRPLLVGPAPLEGDRYAFGAKRSVVWAQKDGGNTLYSLQANPRLVMAVNRGKKELTGVLHRGSLMLLADGRAEREDDLGSAPLYILPWAGEWDPLMAVYPDGTLRAFSTDRDISRGRAQEYIERAEFLYLTEEPDQAYELSIMAKNLFHGIGQDHGVERAKRLAKRIRGDRLMSLGRAYEGWGYHANSSGMFMAAAREYEQAGHDGGAKVAASYALRASQLAKAKSLMDVSKKALAERDYDKASKAAGQAAKIYLKYNVSGEGSANITSQALARADAERKLSRAYASYFQEKRPAEAKAELDAAKAAFIAGGDEKGLEGARILKARMDADGQLARAEHLWATGERGGARKAAAEAKNAYDELGYALGSEKAERYLAPEKKDDMSPYYLAASVIAGALAAILLFERK